ncbi:hypothetical protein SERLA73DRAFT_142852 [Serpula lacrymans var. lacrymans S7.3]|uniref:Uncharacterized protein n=1 Tax=Serpula lacrymans var. lacrymans (strain S7.3) TaxID=936435 RepID=F8Q8I5_SERL3|nr:hypothetical protein SERLA73DRAFT_142852 [Serpula lacrymans var. lacrymans S7.3]
MDDLSEGEDSRFYLLQQTIVLNVVQLPQQGKPVAAKWRLLYRISKRLLVGVITFNGETLKQEPEMHEYSYE